MKIKDIEAFFEEVNGRLGFPIRVILTGEAAGVIYGIDRATFDIDFEVNFPKKKTVKKKWDELQRIFEKVAVTTQITPQYAEDIDRWSSIALPAKESRLVRKIGKVEVRILLPVFWAIGKLTRYLESDSSDLVTVLRKTKASPRLCAQVWGHALAISPPSPVQSRFKHQVENFIEQYGKTIWGKSLDPEKMKILFQKAALLKRPK